MCHGCRQKYVKPSVPPMDLCVRHQEWQEFVPVGSSSTQVRFGNVYYHVNIPCILTRCPYFTSEMLVIPPAIAVQLLPVHTEFGIGRTYGSLLDYNCITTVVVYLNHQQELVAVKLL